MARRPTLQAFHQVVAEHGRRLNRLASRRALPRLKGLYDDAMRQVAAKLRAQLRAGLGDAFTTHQLRIVMAQLKQGQLALNGRMAGELGDASKEAQVEAVRALSADIARLEKTYTGAEITLPIEESYKLRSLVMARRPAMDAMHQRSIARWGARLFTQVHEGLSLTMATGATVEQVIASVPELAAQEWWQGERIVRTEMAWAYNSAHNDALVESAEVLPDLMKRWTEHIDDDTGQPLDDRVAPDSIAMHGQVVAPDEEFEMPDDPSVPAKMRGMTWTAPPNRPNDRATIQPWRSGWGIPAWTFQGGRRVDLA